MSVDVVGVMGHHIVKPDVCVCSSMSRWHCLVSTYYIIVHKLDNKIFKHTLHLQLKILTGLKNLHLSANILVCRLDS